MKSVELLIVGAGPTGLGAAHRLYHVGHDDWLILEATNRVGGLARSITNPDGFTFDIGGHVLFGGDERYRAALDAALPSGWTEIQRQAWVWMQGRFLPYPFQHHLRYLDPATVYECVSGLIRAQLNGGDPPSDFAGWMKVTFGDGITRHFMRPYNEKVWATDLEDMSADWIAQRVAVVDAERVLRNVILGEDVVDWGPNRTFRYPLRGGTGAIFEALADPVRDRIAFGDAVAEVDPARHVVTTCRGRRFRYGALLTAAPLNWFISACGGTPPDIRAAAQSLQAIGTTVIGIGLDRPGDGSRNWVYYPEPWVPFHRVTYLSNYSPHMTPGDDQTLLMAEISHRRDEVPDPDTVVKDVIAGMEACGLLEPADTDRLATVWCHTEHTTYPVPTLRRDRPLRTIDDWLGRHGISSRGRLGSWRYEIGNMDHAFLQGWEWVERVLTGTPETVWQPACG